MKKILFALVCLFVTAGAAHANQDNYGSMRPAAWRSSITCVSEGFVALATGTVHVHAVSVDSATLNFSGNSYVAIFNSTTPPNSGNAPNFITTGTYTNTNFTGQGSLSMPPYIYDVPFSSGVIVSKTGGACVDILWDFIVPKIDPLFPVRP